MTNLIELPETANSAEAWRRQIAEVCEREGIYPTHDGSGKAFLTPERLFEYFHSGQHAMPFICYVLRRNFTVTPDNCADICAGIRLYLGMHQEDPIDTRALMEGK